MKKTTTAAATTTAATTAIATTTARTAAATTRATTAKEQYEQVEKYAAMSSNQWSISLSVISLIKQICIFFGKLLKLNIIGSRFCSAC